MIKTNLLKTRLTKASQKKEAESFDIPEFSQVSSSGAGSSVKALISFLIILFFPVALLIYEKFNLQVINNEAAQLRSELNRINADIEQKKLESTRVESIKNKISSIEFRTKEIVDLTKGRLIKIKGLDFLQSIVPERVWLTSIQSKASKVTFAGFAISDDDISEFLKKMEGANFYKGVVIQKSQEAKTKEGIVKFFEIIAQEGDE